MGRTGATRRDRAFTLGLEYERILTSHLRIGGVLEYAGGDEDFIIGVVPVAWYLNGWSVYAGPGVERKQGESTEVLARVGGRYSFEFEHFEVSPQVNFDWVDGDVVTVIGFAITRPF